MTRGIRNAFRNGVRTFSIIVILGLSIALALTMLIARSAVQKKIDSVKSSIGTSISVAPAGVQGFEGGGEPLKASDIAKITSLPHVASVVQSLRDRLTTDNSSLTSAIEAGSLGRRFSDNNGQSFTQTTPPGGMMRSDGSSSVTRTFTPPVNVSGTNDLNTSEAATDGKVTLTSGNLFDVASSDAVAIIGKDLATKNNLSVGSTFTAYNTTVKVVGIFDTGTAFSNNAVVMPLATLQKLSGQTDQVTSATVKADSIANVSSVVNAIKSKLGSTADVTSQESASQAALSPLENIKTISLFSLIGAVVAGSVIILLTMVMIVRERRREIGVLKAIGASNVTVVTQFIAEAVTFTLIAAVVGILLGIVGGNPVTKVLVNNSTSTTSSVVSDGRGEPMRMGGEMRLSGPRGTARNLGLDSKNLKDVQAAVGWSVLAYGLATAIVIAVAGSAVAALLIAKIRPAEVMRTE
jgi:putative ABC transport system permease protein